MTEISDLNQSLQIVKLELNPIEEQDIVKMPERNFVLVYLPFFAGDEKLQYPATIQTWINHANGPYNPVHVVDTDGKVLFVIPPLFDRSAINPIMNNATSISHVINSARQLTQVHPVQGKKYIEAELTKRTLIMKVPANVLKHLETWNAIFVRYNRPPLMIVENTTKSEGKVDKPNDDPGYDFEPA